MRLKILLLGVLIISLIACQKKNTRIDYNHGINAGRTYVAAQQMMTQLLNTYFKSLTDSVLIETGESQIDGAAIYYNNAPEESILIKYPIWGNDDGYGHWRINSYTAIPRTDFADPEVTVDITFSDFLYDKDTLIVKNLVVNALGKTDGVNDHYNVSADHVEIIYRDTTGMMSFDFDQQYVLHKDKGTIYTSPDDYFMIGGTMKGITKGMLSFHSEINADSVVMDSYSCTWLKAGIITVETTPFTYYSYVNFPKQDTCFNEYAIVINGDPFPYPFDM